MIRIPCIAAALFALSAAAGAGDVKVAMTHKADSAGPSVPVTYVEGTEWQEAPFEKIAKVPAFRAKPQWGQILLKAGTDRSIAVVLDDAGPGEALMYVDANNNEDLTDDGDPAKEYSKEGRSLGKYWKLQIERGKAKSDYQMYVWYLRDNAKKFNAYRGMDWWEGTATLAGETVRFGIVDLNSDAMFSDLDQLALSVDYNRDGRLDGERDSNERFEGTEPFPAGGRGWVIKSCSESGDEVVLAEHTEPVALRPSLGAGAPAPDFTGTDAEGNDVSLSSFLGRVVLVQFWSTTSHETTLALDRHKELWNQYRLRGYTILGVNLDVDAEKAKEYAVEHGMDWPIVYDGGMLEGPIAKLYRTYTWPRLYLLDADGIIRDNMVQPTELGKLLEEMLSDADAEPLVAAKAEDLARFLPQVEKGDWWLAWHQRHGEYDAGEFLLYMVMESSKDRWGVVVTSTAGWSYLIHVDRATGNPVRVTPTFTDWDQKKEKIAVAPEKERSVTVDGAPAIAMLREYPSFDVLFQFFPSAPQGRLHAITEVQAGKSTVAAADVACETFLDVNGRLVAKYRAGFDRRLLRVKQTWEAGLPFPRRTSYSNSISGSRGVLILCRSGKQFGLAFPARLSNYILAGVDTQTMDPSAWRCPQRNLIGEDAMAAVLEKLAPGVATQSYDFKGRAAWQRGDIVKLYWQVRSIPKTLSGPRVEKDPEKSVSIPTSGLFVLECIDTRRVGTEDFLFLMAHGEDTRPFSYDAMTVNGAGQQAQTIAEMLSGSGPAMFSNPDYWLDKDDPKKARWDRAAFLRARRYVGYSYASTLNGRQATTWVLVLRREDLSLRAAYGFHIDSSLRVGRIGVVADAFQQGPAFVRQSLQLVRPQDWMLIQAFPGLKVGAAKGNVLNISPKDVAEGGFFRFEMLKDEDTLTQLVKNDKFFLGFADLLAKRTPPPDEKKKKRKAQVSLTEQDVAKLEGGFTSGDFSAIIRGLEAGIPKRNVSILRTTNGPRTWVYHGYNGAYAWWRESLVLNWNEGWMGRIRTYVPTPLPPGT
ncbi:MAG: TlpA family protein disulfide reductase [Candidatus Brocadiae bacterium]|nr:TlpA family protein disulfide reductase [Candidatus Brocadiia bacterium]